MSFKLLVNSQSRISSSTSSSNFIVQLPQPFYCKDYKYIRLAYCQFYNTIYNVTSANNNVDIKVSGVTYTATVSAGDYNANSLATVLQSAMTSAISNGWSVVYNPSQFTYTITGTTAFQLLFSSGTHASTSLWQVLGFASTTGLAGIDTTSATSTTSTQVVQFDLPLQVFINITNLPSSNIWTSDGDTFSFIVPVDVNPGNIVQYDSMSNFDQYVKVPDNLNFINTLQVTLTSRKNTSISLNGSEWMFAIEFVNDYTPN